MFEGPLLRKIAESTSNVVLMIGPVVHFVCDIPNIGAIGRADILLRTHRRGGLRIRFRRTIRGSRGTIRGLRRDLRRRNGHAGVGSILRRGNGHAGGLGSSQVRKVQRRGLRSVRRGRRRVGMGIAEEGRGRNT